MRDVLDDLRLWVSVGEPFALATVADVHHSAPRPPGAVMTVQPAP
jgi:xanthine/CO dehydrogenase XdhC/CoxF family maturation factor